MGFRAASIRHAIFPLWVRKNGSSRLRYLAELRQSQYWTRQRVENQQWSLLKELLAHAYEWCPYYRDKFQAAGVRPEDIRSWDEIDAIPTLSKEEVQEHREEMVSKVDRSSDLIRDMTGGSTGSPMLFYYDKDRHDRREAAALRHDQWTGWDIGERRAILWGAPRDVPRGWKNRARERLIDRRIILDASSIDEAAMHSFYRELIDYRPLIIQAYANTLALFARYLELQRGPPIRPKAIITSAEVLTAESRGLIERVFACRVYNRYGSREVGVVASECDVHDGMHVNAENLLVEVLIDGRSSKGDDGEVLITDLRNRAMPLIRYRIRDVGRISSMDCKCLRGLPLFELSGGRVTDFLTAINGSKVSGVVIATYVITNLSGVRQIQFVQSERGSIDVNLVKGPEWSLATDGELQQRVRRFLGAEMKVQLRFVTHIPPTASGKYRFSISHV